MNNLSWECWRCLNDCLLLYNSSLSLSNVTGSVSIELEPSVIAISNHSAEAEESRCGVSASWNGRNCYRCDEVEHSPKCAENQLDLNPRNAEESLNNMEQVEHQQNTGEPEAGHRHSIEKWAAGKIGVLRGENAYEAEEIENLKQWKWVKQSDFFCDVHIDKPNLWVMTQCIELHEVIKRKWVIVIRTLQNI